MTLLHELPAWLLLAVELVLAALVGAAVQAVAARAVRHLSRWNRGFTDIVIAHSRAPTKALLPLLSVAITARAFGAPHSVQRIALVLVFLAVGWMLTRIVRIGEDVIVSRVSRSGNLSGRKVRTQVRLLRRVVNLIVGTLTLAAVMMMFARVRQLGSGLIASAGIVSLVLGFAAQRALGNLLAGIQIAITQPIREDDAVLVEGEWGWIEEITLTYVVVKLWDLRRLVVPIAQFIEKPFQNWTRTSAELLGSVTIHVDYTTPVDELRTELAAIVQASAFWDKKVAVLQVVEAGHSSLTLRALVSASDATMAWDLRCEVREKLVAFLAAKHPDCLPCVRASIAPAAMDAKTGV